MLVDDHESFRRSARRLLTAAGYEVVGEAATGTGALAVVRSLRPHVVVLDVLLPDLSGFEVAEDLARDPDPPAIVLISSRCAHDFGDRIASSPARAFVSKAELSIETLAEVIG